jgi:hypothetical protein
VFLVGGSRFFFWGGGGVERGGGVQRAATGELLFCLTGRNCNLTHRDTTGRASYRFAVCS